MSIKQLNDKKAELYNALRNIQHATKTQGRPMTKSEYKEFTQAENEISEIDLQLKRLEAEENTPAPARRLTGRQVVAEGFRKELEKTVSGAQRGFAATNVRSTISAITSSVSYGGHAVPDATMNEVFFEAAANDAFLGQTSMLDISGAGSTKVPLLERGNGPTVEGRADETTQLVGSTMSFTAATFSPVDMYILTRFANNLIRDGIPATAGAILRACQRELTQHLATCVLSGDGSNYGEFDGLDNTTGVQDIPAGGALTGWGPIIDAYEGLLSKNVEKANIKAVVSPAVWAQIAKFSATDGQPINMPRELEGLEMIVSSAVSDTYGTGADSRIYIGDWSQIYLGMSGDYTMTLTERYADYDQSAFLLLNRADMKVFDVEAMAMVTGITTA